MANFQFPFSRRRYSRQRYARPLPQVGAEIRETFVYL